MSKTSIALLLLSVGFCTVNCGDDDSSGSSNAGGSTATGGSAGKAGGAGSSAGKGGSAGQAGKGGSGGGSGAGAGGSTAGNGGTEQGGDAGSGGSDAGAGGSDAGSGGSDAGSAGSDAGSGGSDAGSGGSDAGSGGSDAGAGGSDAGAGGSDAGAGGSDAGSAGSDAGSGGDAGSDAGSGGDAGAAGDGGAGGDAGAGGTTGGAISEACLGCLAAQCEQPFNNCAADPVCNQCATANPSDPACASNANFLAAVQCGCQPSTCGANECLAECTLLGGSCSDASQCPPVGDPNGCTVATCTNGKCGAAPAAQGTISSVQTDGDCKQNLCDGNGGIQTQNDDTDPFNDGNECTADTCDAGNPASSDLSAGTACTQGGAFCDGKGACVECLSESDCTSGVCTGNVCQAPTCTDTVKNGAETDKDCGGADCQPCTDGLACENGSDCKSLVCTGNKCAAASCTDGNKNGAETSTDCGGPTCLGCADGETCKVNSDCLSNNCLGGLCTSPTCSDNTQNAFETDVDCGGPACLPCASFKTCTINSDCLSGACVAGACRPRLLISEIQTRGSNGGNDEFIEIYNPTMESVTFDSKWTLSARSAVGTCTNNTTSQRFAGTGQVIPSHGHLLYTNSGSNGYDGAVVGDATYSSGITDSSSVLLNYDGVVIDALCFSFDATTLANLTTCATPYVCEGLPVSNAPHNNTSGSSSNVDASLERKPGGAQGNGQDTNDNTADFTGNTAANPQNLASPPAP